MKKIQTMTVTALVAVFCLSQVLASCVESTGTAVLPSPLRTTFTSTQTKISTWTPTRFVSGDYVYQSTKNPANSTRSVIAATRDAEIYMLNATEQAVEQKIAALFPNNCGSVNGSGRSDPVYLSPNEELLAIPCAHGKNLFEVTDRNRKILGQIPNEVPPMEDPNWSSAYCFVYPYHWSNDSRYIYFFIDYCSFWDTIQDYQFTNMASNATNLYRMDTSTGLWDEFVNWANYFSFAPTGRRLVLFTRYGLYHPEEKSKSHMSIQVIDLKTNERVDYQLDGYIAAADAIWSKDGTRFVFAAEQGPPWNYSTDPFVSTYSLYLVDTSIPSITLIKNFSNIVGMVYPTDWEGNLVSMISKIRTGDDLVINTFSFDLDLGVGVTTTPTP